MTTPAPANEPAITRARLAGLRRAVAAALVAVDNADNEGHGDDPGAGLVDHFWPDSGVGRYFTLAAHLLETYQAAQPPGFTEIAAIDVTPQLVMDQDPDRPGLAYSRPQLRDLARALDRLLVATATRAPESDGTAAPGPRATPLPGPDGELLAARLAGLALIHPQVQAVRPMFFTDVPAINATPRLRLGFDIVLGLPPELDLSDPPRRYARDQLQSLLRDVEQMLGIADDAHTLT